MKLELKYKCENTGYARKYYETEYNGKKYSIVIINEKEFDEICTATRDGEPFAPLKDGIEIIIDGKKYKTEKKTDVVTIIKEV